VGKTNLTRQKAARAAIKQLHEQAGSVLLVHYSCESFYDRPDGTSPRITSIAIRRLDSGQTHSFSIHKVAELHHADLAALDSNYDQFEREMLDDFYAFVRLNDRHRWLHWNMRDEGFGFAAIEHRYRVLAGQPIIIPDDRKHDLARMLIELYGPDYAGHPRLQSLIDLNKISRLAFMSGEEEAAAFDRKDYVALHQSTLRKVDIMENIFTRQVNEDLVTQASWWAKNGSSVQGALEYARDHPLGIILFVIGAAIATYLGLYFTLKGGG
jgi:hypothetical protein